MSRTSIEHVIRALDAVNSGSATDDDRKILKIAGGTRYRHGQFELALSMEAVGRKLKQAPGIVESRLKSGVATNKAELDGHAGKDERHRPKRASPFHLPGFFNIGQRGKTKPKKTE